VAGAEGVVLTAATVVERGRPAFGLPVPAGLVSNLSNPKMPVFFTSLLPQFGTSFVVLAAHGLIFAALTLA
jgi:threonine/homoserine/homoserine lactone efflux protein